MLGFANALVLALLAPAAHLPPARLRATPVVASAAANLTMGDMLAGCLIRELRNLPEEEQVLRAQLALETLLETGAQDLEEVRAKLGKDLFTSASTTMHRLDEALGQTDEVYQNRIDSTSEALDAVLAPTREAVRAELELLREEQAARQKARERAAESRRGFKRSFTWRDPTGTALSLAAASPKHPVVKVCEASSFLVGFLLLLALGDVASKVLAPCFLPSAFHALDALQHTTWHHNWWLAMRGPLAVYLLSLCVIVMRSGTDEWAALAIGIVPGEPDVFGTGLVSYKYDWEKDEWRHA